MMGERASQCIQLCSHSGPESDAAAEALSAHGFQRIEQAMAVLQRRTSDVWGVHDQLALEVEGHTEPSPEPHKNVHPVKEPCRQHTQLRLGTPCSKQMALANALMQACIGSVEALVRWRGTLFSEACMQTPMLMRRQGALER